MIKKYFIWNHIKKMIKKIAKFLVYKIRLLYFKLSVMVSIFFISSSLNFTSRLFTESSIEAILLAPGMTTTHGDFCLNQVNTSEYTEQFLAAANSTSGVTLSKRKYL